MVMARSARMGTKTLAVAVLLQTFVMITAIPVKMRLATQPGKVYFLPSNHFGGA